MHSGRGLPRGQGGTSPESSEVAQSACFCDLDGVGWPLQCKDLREVQSIRLCRSWTASARHVWRAPAAAGRFSFMLGGILKKNRSALSFGGSALIFVLRKEGGAKCSGRAPDRLLTKDKSAMNTKTKKQCRVPLWLSLEGVPDGLVLSQIIKLRDNQGRSAANSYFLARPEKQRRRLCRRVFELGVG